MNSYQKIDIKKQIGFLFFLLAFPLNFLYNFGYVKGWLPGIPGLGYPTTLHIILLFLLFYSLHYFQYFFIKKYYSLFILYLLIAIIASIFGYINTYYEYSTAPLYQSLWSIIYLYAYAFLTLFLFEKKIVGKNIFFYFLLIYFFIAFLNIKPNSTILFSLDRIAGASLGHINYQIVSFIFLITWFFYYFSCENPLLKKISLALIAILLIVSGGRSELFGFLFAYMYISIISFKNFTFKVNKSLLIISCLILVCLVFVLIIDIETLLEPLQRSRHLEINNLSTSSSWVARQKILETNLPYIFNSPLIGSFGSHFKIGSGAYIHNFLSVWQQYGIIPFVMYLILIFTPFIHLTYQKLKYHSNSKTVNAALFLATYSLLLVLITKSVFWDYLGLSIGVYLYYTFKHTDKITYD